MSIKAVITASKIASGTRYQLLGSGATEQLARQAAYRLLHSGHNDHDNEYAGGELVDCTMRLGKALHPTAGDGDDYTRQQWAAGSLFLNDAGELDAAHYCVEDWEASRE